MFALLMEKWKMKKKNTTEATAVADAVVVATDQDPKIGIDFLSYLSHPVTHFS
jgi:hypothetical protein